jgi:peptidoglycan/LPS O-acetylase OafA/YrhL
MEQDAPGRIAFRDTGASVWLDATRGCAALLVLADHFHNLYFAGRETALKATGHPLWTACFYLLRTAGTAAVVVFFVLSGYLIGGSVLRAVNQRRWSWADYLTHRFVRLWLVLLPALMLCAVWDAARVALLGGSAGFATRLAAAGVTIKLFAANALFLGSIHAATFGSDGVLWSLTAEFWYYLLLPLGVLAVRGQARAAMRVAYAALFLLVAVFVGRGLMGLFPIWLLGVALAMVPPPRCCAAVRWLAAALFVPGLLLLGAADWPWRYFKMGYVLGSVTMLFLWVILSARQKVSDRDWHVRGWRRLAGLSYSLYLVHYPLLAFGAAWLVQGGKWLPDARTLLEGAGICAVAISYSYAVASGTEFHTDMVRSWVQRRLWAPGSLRG